jgi:cytochrome c peroxidase
VLASPAEMGSSDERAAARVREDAGYRRAFRNAFRGRPDTAVTRQSLRIAVAAYVRSLVALDSRFDRAVRGDSTALTRAERHGFTVFMGKGRCATCHFIPLTNGTMPPDFTSSEPEIIGVPERDPKHPGSRLDSDAGRARVDDESAHHAAFKVPTLRNVAETAPYMHNGVFASLQQVVEFYDRGGGAGLGLAVPGQTLPPRRLHLSPGEKTDLVAFLRTLSDLRPNH